MPNPEPETKTPRTDAALCRSQLGQLLEMEFGYVVPSNVARHLETDLANTQAALKQSVEALNHMRLCRNCAEGDWKDCEGGRQALEALTAAQPHLPRQEGKPE